MPGLRFEFPRMPKPTHGRRGSAVGSRGWDTSTADAEVAFEVLRPNRQFTFEACFLGILILGISIPRHHQQKPAIRGTGIPSVGTKPQLRPRWAGWTTLGLEPLPAGQRNCWRNSPAR